MDRSGRRANFFKMGAMQKQMLESLRFVVTPETGFTSVRGGANIIQNRAGVEREMKEFVCDVCVLLANLISIYIAENLSPRTVAGLVPSRPYRINLNAINFYVRLS